MKKVTTHLGGILNRHELKNKQLSMLQGAHSKDGCDACIACYNNADSKYYCGTKDIGDGMIYVTAISAGCGATRMRAACYCGLATSNPHKCV